LQTTYHEKPTANYPSKKPDLIEKTEISQNPSQKKNSRKFARSRKEKGGGWSWVLVIDN